MTSCTEDVLPAPALAMDVAAEYTYTTFPWPEIRDWLVPHLAPYRRILVLDGTYLTFSRIASEDPAFPWDRVVGIWDERHASGEVAGVPILRDLVRIARLQPDLVLSTLNSGNREVPPLDKLHLLTSATIFPNLLRATPYAGSMLISPAGPGRPSIPSMTFPDWHREQILRHLHRYVMFSGWAAGKEVLDVACGAGYGTHLLSRVAARATGMDLNEHLIGYARRHNAAHNTDYRCADLTRLERGETWDLVTSVETFEHIPSEGMDAYVDALAEALRPGGTLLCTTPLALETVRAPFNREHVAEYSAEAFLGTLSRRFEIQAHLVQDRAGKVTSGLPEGIPTPQSVDPGHFVQIAVGRRR